MPRRGVRENGVNLFDNPRHRPPFPHSPPISICPLLKNLLLCSVTLSLMNNHPSRRTFIKSALAVPAALAMAPSFGLTASAESTTPSTPLPTRQLGKGGRHVTMVSLGGMMNAYSPEYLDMAWSMGIRYFDNADCYIGKQSEHRLGAWLAKYPERRKRMLHCFQGSSPPGPRADARNG